MCAAFLLFGQTPSWHVKARHDAQQARHVHLPAGEHPQPVLPLATHLVSCCVLIPSFACRDAAERDLAAAERAVKQLELAAPKAAQLAAAKREEAADLEARLEQLQVRPD
jgi:hypothetical protein